MAELVVALDFPEVAPAWKLVDLLSPKVQWFKVGLELFTAAGPGIITDLKSRGCRVFLDLKLFDIPNTVQGAVRTAASLDVDMLTLHLLGGRAMAAAALEGRKHACGSEPGPILLGVTLLTSMDEQDLPAKDPGEAVLDLASRAHAWGLDGVVCSGLELQRIRTSLPDSFVCLTPGIRREMGLDDQKRTVTPAHAVRDGSDFLVVGRPISRSVDPVCEVDLILSEMQQHPDF
ncbi:MAG: orotidine-5'-phosphate decarboxylase [Desulfovibrionales bacterium]